MSEENTIQEPPPAATIVSEGDRTEQTVALQAELQAERAARQQAEANCKKAQTQAAEWQNEAQRLKAFQEDAARQTLVPKQRFAFKTLLHDA